jgi:DNA-binding XRE family transcriptional regulator
MRRKLSQSKVAENLNISQQYYSRIEMGKKKPSTPLGQEIAHFFGLSIEEMWKLLYAQEGDHSNEPSANAS